MTRVFSKAIIPTAILSLGGCVVSQPVPVMSEPAPAPWVQPYSASPYPAPVQAPAVVQAYPAAPQPQPQYDDQDYDVVPPLPTFASIADCEMAYGPGACGTGAAVYAQANIAPPVAAGNWFIPFAFGAMTAVLINDFFAPPAVYSRGVHYHSYLAPVVIQKYRSVTPDALRRYQRASPEIRRSATLTGPVRYDARRNLITGEPYGRGYTLPRQDRRPVQAAPSAPAPVGPRALPPAMRQPMAPQPAAPRAFNPRSVAPQGNVQPRQQVAPTGAPVAPVPRPKVVPGAPGDAAPAIRRHQIEPERRVQVPNSSVPAVQPRVNPSVAPPQARHEVQPGGSAVRPQMERRQPEARESDWRRTDK